MLFSEYMSHRGAAGPYGSLGFPGGSSGRETPCPGRRYETQVRAAGQDDPLEEGGKIPWRRKWEPTPVFLPGESHGQRSLAGYSPGVEKSGTRLN